MAGKVEGVACDALPPNLVLCCGEDGPEAFEFKLLHVSDAEREIVERVRFTSDQVAKVFGVPRWLIDSSYQPTPEERARWRRRVEKDARRARYRRRYQRGRR